MQIRSRGAIFVRRCGFSDSLAPRLSVWLEETLASSFRSREREKGSGTPVDADPYPPHPAVRLHFLLRKQLACRRSTRGSRQRDFRHNYIVDITSRNSSIWPIDRTLVMDTFSAPRFHDDEAARAYLESLRWPDGPVCPHCGVINHAYPIKPAGTFRCAEPACRSNFTVTMNSPMERSHIALHKWVQAFHLMCSSKKGMSAHQLHRTLGITYRSAWFMAHRIRECMRSGGLGPLGGEGKIVEADETYYGRTEQPAFAASDKGRPFTKGGKTRPGQQAPDRRACRTRRQRPHVPCSGCRSGNGREDRQREHRAQVAAAYRRKQALFQRGRYFCRA